MDISLIDGIIFLLLGLLAIGIISVFFLANAEDYDKYDWKEPK